VNEELADGGDSLLNIQKLPFLWGPYEGSRKKKEIFAGWDIPAICKKQAFREPSIFAITKGRKKTSGLCEFVDEERDGSRNLRLSSDEAVGMGGFGAAGAGAIRRHMFFAYRMSKQRSGTFYIGKGNGEDKKPGKQGRYRSPLTNRLGKVSMHWLRRNAEKNGSGGMVHIHSKHKIVANTEGVGRRGFERSNPLSQILDSQT